MTISDILEEVKNNYDNEYNLYNVIKNDFKIGLSDCIEGLQYLKQAVLSAKTKEKLNKLLSDREYKAIKRMFIPSLKSLKTVKEETFNKKYLGLKRFEKEIGAGKGTLLSSFEYIIGIIEDRSFRKIVAENKESLIQIKKLFVEIDKIIMNTIKKERA